MFSAYTSKMKLHLITLGFGEHHTLYNVVLNQYTTHKCHLTILGYSLKLKAYQFYWKV